MTISQTRLIKIKVTSSTGKRMKKVTNSEMAMVNVHIDNHVDVRAFDYVLNKKKAKSKLLKGAKRESHL